MAAGRLNGVRGHPDWTGVKVLFRTDASAMIGSGHVMRCRTLGQALRREGAAVEFICRDLTGNLVEFLRRDGFRVHCLRGPSARLPANASPHDRSGGVDIGREIEESEDVLKGSVVDLLIVDHYGLDARYESALGARSRALMVIDDLADRDHSCDLLLDQNLYQGAEGRYRGRIPPECITMLGPRFALVRPEFNGLRRSLRPREGAVRRLFVFFGGSDALGMTDRALDALERVKSYGIGADIVVGSATPQVSHLAERCSRLPGVELHVQTPEMARLMARTDIALGAGGSTHWERCMLGLPAIVVTVAANQEASSAELARRGAVRLLGRAEQADAAGLAEAAAELCAAPERVREMSEASMRIIGPDDGVHRVMATLRGFLEERGIVPSSKTGGR